MKISYDAAKRDKTLAERGLDFDDATDVFAGETFQAADDRRDYGNSDGRHMDCCTIGW